MGKRGTKSHLEVSSQTNDLLSLKPFGKALKTRTHSHNPAAIKYFIEQLPVIAGIKAGKKMKLLPWQYDLIKTLYSKDCRQLVVSIARKNGKSMLAAALALYHLCWQGAEDNGEVYIAAVNSKQASIIWNACAKLIYRCAQLNARCVIKTHEKIIFDKVTGTSLRALASDGAAAHGLSPSFVIIDELAQVKKPDMYDALATACGGRANPKMLIISTQASDPEHLFSQLLDDSLESDDPAFKAILYSAPMDSDWQSEQVWRDCNPSLGQTRTIADLRSAARLAKRIPTREAAFRNLHLNQRVKAESDFLPIAEWDACKEDFTEDDLLQQDCHMAVDLASVQDLCAIACYFPDTKRMLVWHFTNEERVEQVDEQMPYQTWVKAGHLIATKGNTTNKLNIVHHIAQCCAKYNVTAFSADRWGMPETQRLLDEHNVPIPDYQPHGQGYKDMSPAIKALEEAILLREIKHNGSPILRWQLQGVAVDEDPAGNRKFVKNKSSHCIDGVIAMTMALNHAIIAGTNCVPNVFSI